MRLVEEAASGTLAIQVSGVGLGSDPSGDQLRVYPEDADPDDPSWPAMAGTVGSLDGPLTFVPRYPLQAGLTYRVRLETGRPVAAQDFLVEVPASDSQERVRVEGIYPSGEVVPANLLRFYIHFSAPVRPWEPYRHLVLEEESGRQVLDAFHEVRAGLWTPDRKRLTLLLEPGRIKRGLVPNREMGPPLRPGSKYRLVVRSTWPDLQGCPLEAEFVKIFEVAGDDRRSPDPREWQVELPGARSREPLRIEFPEAMDSALLERAFSIIDPRGALLAGQASIGPAERSWLFIPDRPWAAGTYSLRVGLLEDLAGNSLDRLFDVDLRAPDNGPRKATHVLEFTVAEIERQQEPHLAAKPF